MIIRFATILIKVRIVMGSRDDTYELAGVVELDDVFIKTHSDKEKEDKTKQGIGSDQQSKVLVMAKVDPKQDRPKKKQKVFHISVCNDYCDS